LYDNVIKYIITPISSTGLKCNLWIDGSFLTKKIEPNDVDLAIEYDFSLNSNIVAQNIIVNMTNNPSKNSFQQATLLDVYCFDTNDAKFRPYWLGQFGFSRETTPKGILLIKINGGV
jgi:hypothetical protein